MVINNVLNTATSTFTVVCITTNTTWAVLNGPQDNIKLV